MEKNYEINSNDKIHQEKRALILKFRSKLRSKH
jgi:hypothetical protein